MCTELYTFKNRQMKVAWIQYMMPLSDHIIRWKKHKLGEMCKHIHCVHECRSVKSAHSRVNRNNNSPEQFIETVQYNQAALIHFLYQLTHF